MKRPRQKLLFNLILIVIIFLGLIFITGSSLRTLKTLDYFKLKDIIVKETASGDLSYLKGRNIFSINLKEESRYAAQLYPDYKKVRLIRILPNRLFVDFIRRRPLAYIKLYRYFCVDEDAVLFDMSESEKEDLPVILGLDTKIFGPKTGQKYNIKELATSLDIIKEVQKNKILKDYKIKKIDVVSLSNTSFFTASGLEIKLGQDNIKDKINILSGLLPQVKNDLGNIKYIDLRFKEPLIKLNDAK